MRKLSKVCFVIGLTAAMSCSNLAVAFAGQWQQSGNRWWYQEDNGTYPTNTWKQIGNKSYYFDENGWMLANTTTPDGFFVGPDGAWDGAWIPSGSSASVTLSNKQKAVMEHILSPIISINSYDNRRFSMSSSALTSEDLASYLFWYLNQSYGDSDSLIVKQLPSESSSDYTRYFDKATTLKRLNDIFGKGANLSDSVMRENWFTVTSDKIGISGADGEGFADPKIQSYAMENGKLIVTASYHLYFNVEELDYDGKVKAVFIPNDNSFFGYTLQSVNGIN